MVGQPQSGPGSPGDALGAFETAALSAAKTAAGDTSDPRVGAAFSLGWQIAEMYRPGLRRRSRPLDDDLPGLGALDDDERAEVLVDQVQVAVVEFAVPIAKAGLPALDVAPLRASLGTDGFADAVLALHRRLLGTLTAVDYRYGKAYSLGRALADTCRKPADVASLRKELSRERVASLRGWLDDLSTALPAHAAHSVSTSLQRCADWVTTTAGAADFSAVRARLMRQGELWRALLSGEKRGTELLEIGNYLDAAGDLAKRMGAIARRAIARFWVLLLVIAALLVAGVVLLVIGGGSKDVAGAAALLGAVGLTWKGVGGALGQLAGKLEPPLWGAVLDVAIAQAITVLPENTSDHGGRAALAERMSRQPHASE